AAEKSDAREEADPMQDAERMPDDGSRRVPRRQHRKCRGRFYKRQENNSADPDDHGEKHQKAKDRHGKAVLGCQFSVLSETLDRAVELPARVAFWTAGCK